MRNLMMQNLIKLNHGSTPNIQTWKSQTTGLSIGEKSNRCLTFICLNQMSSLPMISLVSLPKEVPKYPTKIHSDAMSEVWFRPDPKFKIPESYMYYYFISPLALTSPENTALIDLLVTILNQLLVKELYPANAVKLSHQIYTGDKGIVVEVNGFNQKLPLLLATITKYMIDCPILVTENLFHVMKAEQLKAYYYTFLKPEILVRDVSTSILKLVHWTSIDKHAALSGVDFNKFKIFAKQFVDHIYLQCLVQGNITKEDVIQNSKNCTEILKCGSLSANTLPQLRGTEIPFGARCCRVKNFYKADSNSVMLMKEPLSNQLRTQEQLGNSVSCLMQDTFGILSYYITVSTQADKFTTEHIDERIEKFLRSFLEILEKLYEKELSIVKNAMVKSKQCEILNLCEEAHRNWNEILTEKYIFDRRDREINAINGTSIAELREWMEKHVLGGTNLRKLSIQVVGTPQDRNKIENESSEKNNIANSSEESTGTSKSYDNGITASCDTLVKRNNEVKFSLEYMTDMPNEKTTKPSKYYITDIEDYKKSLHVFPASPISTEQLTIFGHLFSNC